MICIIYSANFEEQNNGLEERCMSTNSSLNISKKELDASKSDAEDRALQRNLSILTESTNISHQNESIQLDRSFIAELEKDLYSNSSGQNDLEFNSSTSNSSKEMSYQKINNFKPMQDCTNSTSSLTNPLLSDQKSAETLPIGYGAADSTKSTVSSIDKQQISSSSAGTTVAFSDNCSNSTNSQTILNRDWYEKPISSTSSLYSQSSDLSRESVTTNTTIPLSSNEINHSFVTLSNRVVPKTTQQTPPTINSNDLTTTTAHPYIYSSVASLYGSVNNMYDSVTTTPACSLYYGQVSSTNMLLYANGGQIDQHQSYSEQPTVFYDEVTTDDYLRPHRPAPSVPPQLSAQQIQRRLEKIKQQQGGKFDGGGDGNHLQPLYAPAPGDLESEQHKIAQIMYDLGPNTVELEVRNALRAASGDVNLAIRHYKIDQLIRYYKRYIILPYLI